MSERRRGASLSTDPKAGLGQASASVSSSLEDHIGRRFRWSATSGLVGLVASVATALLVSHTVPPAEFGRASVVLAAWGFMTAPLTWAGSVLLRFGPVELAQSGRLKVTPASRLVFALPVLAVLLFAMPALGNLVLGWSAYIATLTALWLCVTTASDVLTNSAAAAQAFRPLAISNLLSKGGPAVLLLVPFFAPLSIAAEHLLSAYVLAFLAAALVLLLSLRGMLVPGSPDRGVVREMWRYGYPLLLGLPALTLIGYFDPLVLANFVTKGEVGTYQLATPVLTVCSVLGASMTSVLTPELIHAVVRGDPGVRERYIHHQQPRLALALLLAGLGGALVSPVLVRAVLGVNYAESAGFVALLFVAGGLMMAGSTLHPLVAAANSQGSAQIANFCQAATNVILDLWLVRFWRASGVAAANIFAWGAFYLCLSWLLRLRVGARFTQVPVHLAAALATLFLVVGPVPDLLRVGIGLAMLAYSAIATLWLLRHMERA